MSADRDRDRDRDEREQAATAVDDVTAGVSTSGIGGVTGVPQPDASGTGEPTGIDAIVEQGRRAGWGEPERGGDQLDDERTSRDP